jgi:hypothetical protein
VLFVFNNLLLICRVYLVNFSDANYIKCLKIMKRKVFNENEWKAAEILKKTQNKNVIDYDAVNEVVVNGQEYITFMLEYVNAKAYLFIY